MQLNDSVFYSAPTASKSFQGIGHREDSIVRPAVDQHISHPVLSEHKHIEFCFRNRCQFEVTIQDGTGSTTAMISDKIGGGLLSLTVAEIHEIRCIKEQLYLNNIFNKYVYHDASIYYFFAIWLAPPLSTQLLQMLMADTFAVDSVNFVAASCKLSDLVLNNAE
ncbi:hypothetical protein H5410_018772 [Solanum commersonii]|uniref:Uncharacterized protein n=1 Tax=Solanum commersonii TaxID=4109 RepID=A0A9J6A437_SOLCO|nr:hypothetical protein H5410_018772 [Solanum commersonii]